MLRKNKNNLVWVDLEMTGLNTQKDKIIEIAVIVTDDKLECMRKGPNLAIYQTDEVLKNMNEWCQHQHSKSGLVERVRLSHYDEKKAEDEVLKFLLQFVEEGKSPICGNSICQDRRFLAQNMPRLEAFFHYRIVDVSSIKLLAQRWRPEIEKGVKKAGTHIAMDDVVDSINELKHYREHWLV